MERECHRTQTETQYQLLRGLGTCHGHPEVILPGATGLCTAPAVGACASALFHSALCRCSLTRSFRARGCAPGSKHSRHATRHTRSRRPTPTGHICMKCRGGAAAPVLPTIRPELEPTLRTEYIRQTDIGRDPGRLHSARSATIGSTWAARRAGAQAENSATASKIVDTAV